MVFKMKAYDGWTELSPSELKVKCAPYKEIIKKTWARLKSIYICSSLLLAEARYAYVR